MNALSRAYQLADHYLIAPLNKKPTTTSFWYLPEPPNIQSAEDLKNYQLSTARAPLYLMDYRRKLSYTLENPEGIIVLPYAKPIGKQINPEAAFQYALGLHDQYIHTNQPIFFEKFLYYANYFVKQQSKTGVWSYQFDWFAAKSPWHSALAQTRGASVMLRAWLHTNQSTYLEAARRALMLFIKPTSENGFLHTFAKENCAYFEEYPQMPTGTLNGFMASLLGLWELNYWLREKWLDDLWNMGSQSLELMLPHYNTGWWSLYDLDEQSPVPNVNSPRYHQLEIDYLQVLSVLTQSEKINKEYQKRVKQSARWLAKIRAIGLKTIRKIMYK